MKTAFAQLRGSSAANTRKLTVTTPLESPPANTDAARDANERCAALAHQGRFREAAAAFDEAFYFEPENAEGFSNLRFVLRRLNHLNGAIASSRKRFAFGPSLPKRITTSETLSQRLANRRLRQSDAAPS